MKLGNISRVREIAPPRQFEVITGTSHLKELEGGTPREYKELALFTIDEVTGSVTVNSEYGNYSYRWTSIGSASLASFLCSLDMHYFMEKAAQQPWRELDRQDTIARLRRELIDRRRDGRWLGDCSKDRAREVWDALQYLEAEGFRTTREFYMVFSQFEVLSEFFPPCDLAISERNTGTADHFWNVIWKAFTDHLRELETVERQKLEFVS